MKRLFKLVLIMSLLTAGCTSTNKTDNSSTNVDTSGYIEQLQDKTQMKDTAIIQTDSMKHNDSIPN